MDRKQRIQNRQYAFPYHYIPGREGGHFTQTRHWSWGFRYLGGLQVVLDRLARMEFGSLVDIGCGDGRFLREVAREYPGARLAGIDYSERAIDLARAMNPGLEFHAENILESVPGSGPAPEHSAAGDGDREHGTEHVPGRSVQPASKPDPEDNPERRFEVATAIEVLEHIPPDDLPAFLQAIADRLVEGGRFLLTVPHENKAVSAKHYQHFSSAKLESLLEPLFGEIEFVPFDHSSRLLVILSRLMGGAGSHYVVTNGVLNSAFYRLYLRRWLYTGSEERCQRIAAVCVRKS